MAPPALQFLFNDTRDTDTRNTMLFQEKMKKSCQKIREPQWECCNFAAG